MSFLSKFLEHPPAGSVPAIWQGERFQRELYNQLRVIKPRVMVETGVETGVSTAHILQAMDDNGVGKLYSFDPTPKCDIRHPRWELILGESNPGLEKLYHKWEPWDCFLHDSDHGYENQIYEYETAFKFLRPGGWIFSDDTWWGTPIHGAWDHFLKTHQLIETRIKDLAFTQKTV